MNRKALAFVTLALVAAGCDDNKKSSDSPKPDASATRNDKMATLDPKLEQALAATASASAGGANDQGPPPGGVFPPGIADKRHPKGAPMKIEMGAEGSAPRVTLGGGDADGGAAAATSGVPSGTAKLSVAMRTGPRTALPTIDFNVVYGPAKPDKKDNKDDKGAGAAGTDTDLLVVDVKKAAPAADQLGQLPPGTDKEIGALAGSQLRLHCTPEGRTGDLSLQLSKTANPDLERLASSAGEAMLLTIVPRPPKPVGVGGYWLAESRMTWMGLDVITYRSYRVKNIDGDKVTLTFDVRQYAADRTPTLAGLPKGATLDQYESAAQGELDLVRGDLVAHGAEVSQHVTFVFQAEGGKPQQPPAQPGQPPPGAMQAQIEVETKLARDVAKPK
jgi:hypothetical protein